MNNNLLTLLTQWNHISFFSDTEEDLTTWNDARRSWLGLQHINMEICMMVYIKSRQMPAKWEFPVNTIHLLPVIRHYKLTLTTILSSAFKMQYSIIKSIVSCCLKDAELTVWNISSIILTIIYILSLTSIQELRIPTA